MKCRFESYQAQVNWSTSQKLKYLLRPCKAEAHAVVADVGTHPEATC